MATYYLLKNPEKLEQLFEELKGVKKNSQGMLEYRDICRLPYLVSTHMHPPCHLSSWQEDSEWTTYLTHIRNQTAVIKESLRLSSPVPGVIPRVVPAGGITWAGHFLPEGVSHTQQSRAAIIESY